MSRRPSAAAMSGTLTPLSLALLYARRYIYITNSRPNRFIVEGVIYR